MVPTRPRAGPSVDDGGSPDLRLLGPVELWCHNRRVDLGPAESAKVRCMLAVLLRSPGVPVSTTELRDCVWGDRQVSAGTRYKYAGWLRTALAPYGVALAQDDRGYRLLVDADRVDLHRFRGLSDRASRAIALGRLPEASRTGRRALSLWRGPALSGLSGSWVQLFRDQLAREQRAVAIQCFRTEMTLGHDAELLGELDDWETENPTDETIIGLHVLALHRAGQSAMAIDRYRRAERRVRGILHAPLGAALRTLLARVHNNDPELLTSPVLDGYRPSIKTATRPMVEADTDKSSRPVTVAPVTGQPPLAIPRQLPPVARQFAGRAEELAALTDLLARSDRHGSVIAVIGGAAGIGKTTLAVHWANLVADRFPDGQLYVNLRGFDPSGMPLATADAIRGFLDALGVDQSRLPASLDELSALFRSVLAARRMSVILDNARDARQVRPLLPGSPGCVAVVTSRATMAGLVAAEGAFPLTLSVLDDEGARELLGRRLGAERLAADPKASSELITFCAGLPLALSVAAARAITHPHLPLAALVAQLRPAHGRLDGFESGDGVISVRAVFSWSYRCLSKATATAFRLLSLPSGPDIGRQAAASLTGRPADDTERMLGELAAAQLVTEHSPGRFGVHDLLRAYAHECSQIEDTEPQRAAATERLLDHYRHTAHAAAMLINPARTPLTQAPIQAGVVPEPLANRDAAWDWFEAEYRVLRATVAYAADHGYHEHTWQLSWCLADFYHQRGHWHDWVATQELGLSSAQHLADPAAQARCHQYLGYAQARLHGGRDDEGQLGQALRLYKRLNDRSGQASTHAMIAIAFEQLRRYPEALGHARKAVSLRRGLDQPAALANSLNLLGWHLALAGQYGRTISYCEEALGLHRELGNGNGEAATWDSLGYAHFHRGRHAEAVACIENAVDLNERLGDRYQLAVNLVHLADVRDSMGAPRAARDDRLRALTILRELGHPDAMSVHQLLHRRYGTCPDPGCPERESR